MRGGNIELVKNINTVFINESSLILVSQEKGKPETGSPGSISYNNKLPLALIAMRVAYLL